MAYESNGKYYAETGEPNAFSEVTTAQIPDYNNPKPLPTGAVIKPAPNPLVARYAAPREENPLTKAKRELAEQLAGNVAPDEAAIRETTRRNMQAQIDATNAYYSDLLKREEAAGDVRNAQTRAINLRAGLGGSDFASANAAETTEKNKDAVKAIENERLLRVTALFDKIDQRALEETNRQRTLAAASADQRIKLLDELATSARNDVTSLAKSGFTLDRFKNYVDEQGKSVYSQLLNESGMSELEMDAMFNQSVPKKAQKDIHYEKLDSGKVVAFWTGDDGTLQKQEYDFDVPQDMKLHVIEGMPYYEDKETQTLTPAKGFTPQAKPTFSAKDVISNETGLRKEFNGLPVVKDFQSVRNSFNQVTKSAQEAADKGKDGKSKSAADQVLIVAFNKMIDPGSVVKEGEFARSTQGQSVINALKAKADAAVNGGVGLSAEDRKAIVDVTQTLYRDYLALYNQTANEYRSYAGDFGGNADKVAKLAEDATADPLQAKAKAAGYDPAEVQTLRSQGYTDEQIEALLN